MTRPDGLPRLRIAILAANPALAAEYHSLVREIVPRAEQYARTHGWTLSSFDLVARTDEDAARSRAQLVEWREETGEGRPVMIVLLAPASTATSAPSIAWSSERVARRPLLGGQAQSELVHAILSDPLVSSRTIFYATEPVGPDGENRKEDEDLAALKALIRSRGFHLRDGIRSTEDLGGRVWEDLLAQIGRLGRDEGITPFELERRAQEAFSRTRRRAYLRIDRYEETLDDHVSGHGGPLVITGESGAGKSALLANWYARHCSEHPEHIGILHHFGVTPSGGDRHALLLRIMGEIKERCGITDPLPTHADEIDQAFPYWLGHVQRDTLVLVIDALNQLDSDPLAWLPEYVPPRVRLIVSSTDGPALEALRGRTWKELRVEPLSLDQRKKLVRLHLQETGNELTSDDVRRAAAGDASANPLFLRTRLEEMIRPGTSTALNELIDYYLNAHDLDDLYQRVLARLEDEQGKTLVRETLSLLWASRRGLSERELTDLIDGSREEIARLLRALRCHVMEAGELFTFLHDHLRVAIERRYIGDREGGTAREYHRRLAGYFGSLPLTPRSAEEEPWQLRQAEQWEELRRTISRIDMFHAIVSAGAGYELMGYWIAIGERGDAGSAYAQSLERYEKDLGGEIPPEILGELGTFLFDFGRFEQAERCHRRALAIRERHAAEDALPLAKSLDTLAQVLYEIGSRSEALQHARRALTIRTSVQGAGHRDTILCMANLAALLHADGADRDAEMLLHEALGLGERLEEDSLPIVVLVLNNLGAVHAAAARFDAAADCFERARQIGERLYGNEHPQVASGLINLAFARKALGDLDLADALYRRAIAITEETMGTDHPDLAPALTNLAALRRAVGDLEEAEALYRRAVSIRSRWLGEEHLETLYATMRLGAIVKTRGRIEETRVLYASAVAGLRRLLPEEHPDLLRFSEALAGVSEEEHPGEPELPETHGSRSER